MTNLLRAELIKLATTRTFATLAGIAVATSLALCVLVGVLTRPTRESVVLDLFASDTSSVFLLLLGVIGVTGEWRHRTITSALLAAPLRLRFLAAKVVAYAAAGAALSLMVAGTLFVTGYAVVWMRDLPTPPPADLVAQFGRNAVMAALLAAFGVCLGALVRNQVVALASVLVLMFVVEPTLIALKPEFGRYTPIGALATGVSGIPAEDAGLGSEIDLFAPLPAAVLLLAWIAALYAIGGALLRARDLT